VRRASETIQQRRALALAIAVIVVAGGAFALYRRLHADGAYGAVLRTVLSQYPMPVSVSPDGAKILFKTRHEADFEIAVHDRVSGALLRGTRSKDTQLSLTWSPDGTALAFVASHSGNREYHLHLWDLASGTVSRFDAPVTYTAAPPIRWSPQGDALALFVGGEPAGDLVLVQAQGETKGSVRVLGQSVSSADFRWSPDGERVAFVSPDNASGITVADVSRHGGTARHVHLPPDSLVQDLAWSPDGNALLVTAREAADEFFQLELVQLDTGRARSVVRDAFDVRHPYWLPDGRHYVHEAQREGVSEIVLSDLTTGDHRTVSDRTVHNQILGVSESGDQVRFYSSYLDRPPEITALSLSSGETATLSSSGKKGTRPELSEVVAADGGRVPIILWRGTSARTEPRRRLVIIVHGGPHLQELPIWDARTQALTDEGFSVAAVNYRGSTGYGAGFERHEDVHAQAGDIIAAGRHLTAALDVPPERVMLLASSAGTRIAADAVRQAPDAFGAVVLLATVDIPEEYCPQTPVRQAVVAFHGQYDPVVAPARARETIARCFGGRDAWRVFSDEGHFFQRSGSWARVYASLVALGQP
jgi:dipeptidyl aminopeptidase/acylaminoacyl peptidase